MNPCIQKTAGTDLRGFQGLKEPPGALVWIEKQPGGSKNVGALHALERNWNPSAIPLDPTSKRERFWNLNNIKSCSELNKIFSNIFHYLNFCNLTFIAEDLPKNTQLTRTNKLSFIISRYSRRIQINQQQKNWIYKS